MRKLRLLVCRICWSRLLVGHVVLVVLVVLVDRVVLIALRWLVA